MVSDAGVGGVTLEGGDVTLQQEGELPVLFGYVVGGQPGDDVPSCVLVFKG